MKRIYLTNPVLEVCQEFEFPLGNLPISGSLSFPFRRVRREARILHLVFNGAIDIIDVVGHNAGRVLKPIGKNISPNP